MLKFKNNKGCTVIYGGKNNNYLEQTSISRSNLERL